MLRINNKSCGRCSHGSQLSSVKLNHGTLVAQRALVGYMPCACSVVGLSQLTASVSPVALQCILSNHAEMPYK